MDFLKDCMNDVGNPPIDEMHRNWCVGCANRGCERSGMNQSAFDKRVKNWKELLFTNVPRASADDPAYDNIRSKAFSQLGTPAAPKTVVFTPGVPVATPARAQMAQPAAFTRKDVDRPEVEAPAVEDSPELDLEPVGPQPATVVTPRVAPPGNTPFEQGTVLGGGPLTVPAEAPRPPEPPVPGTGPGKTFILEDD